MSDLTHLSLFTGIGGIDLASEWAGFEVVGQVEKDEFCQAILTKHWPDVAGWPDIEKFLRIKQDAVEERGSVWCQICDENFSDCSCVKEDQVKGAIDLDKLTLVTGGEPCQPHSVSGEKRGREDRRYMWDEMLRIVERSRPRWVLNENVPGSDGCTGIVDQKLIDLEDKGYECFPPIEAPAASFGADHTRYRTFILAYDQSINIQGLSEGSIREQREVSFHVDDRWSETLRRRPNLPEPKLRGSRHGAAHYVDRIAATGNSVVPQQVYGFLKSIYLLESTLE